MLRRLEPIIEHEVPVAFERAQPHIWPMAARDRYGYDLKCERCGVTGRIECSENDYPFMSSPDFRVDSLSGPFVLSKLGATSVLTDVECEACGEKVW